MKHMIISAITTFTFIIVGVLICIYLYNLIDNDYIQAIMIVNYGFGVIYLTAKLLMNMAFNTI